MENIKENKMGTQAIPKLLFSVSVPIIISMIVQALYNVVDSIFVAQFDSHAGTGALAIAFPIQNLLLSVSIGLSIGVNALLSRYLGQKNFDKADKTAGQGFFLMLCGYLLFVIIGFFFIKPYVALQASAEGDELLFQYSVEYLFIVCLGSIGVFVQIVCERLLQATGKSFYSMITQLTGAVINIILDPILIFGYFGLPAMGIVGAAVATVIGQIVAAVVGVILNLTINREIRITIKNMIPDLHYLKEILIIGIPAVMMQAIGSVMTFAMNVILKAFSQTAMNVFSVYFKLQSFVFMPVFGLNSGMVPIVAFNYGAKHTDRIFKVVRLALFTAVGYMLLGFLTFQLFPDLLLSFFNADAEMLDIGRIALRRISLSFVFAGISVISISVCQALGKSIYSMFVSIGRQLVVLIPAAYLLSLTGNLSLVWFSFPIAELMSLALCIYFLLRVIKHAFGDTKEVLLDD